MKIRFCDVIELNNLTNWISFYKTLKNTSSAMETFFSVDANPDSTTPQIRFLIYREYFNFYVVDSDSTTAHIEFLIAKYVKLRHL